MMKLRYSIAVLCTAVALASASVRPSAAATIWTHAEAQNSSFMTSDSGFTSIMADLNNTYTNGTGFILYGTSLGISATDGGAFTLNGIDIAIGNGSVLTLNGYDATNQLVGTDILTAGSGSLTAATLTNLGGHSLYSLQLVAPNADWSATFANIALDEAPTGAPEPGTLALLGAGVAALGLRRRRAKAA